MRRSSKRPIVAALVVAAAISYSMFWAPAIALVMDRAEGLGLSTTMSLGLVNLAYAPGALAGSALAGVLAGSLGDLAPFALVAGLSVVTLASLGWLRVGKTVAPCGASSRSARAD